MKSPPPPPVSENPVSEKTVDATLRGKLDRRDFLKTTGTAAVAASIPVVDTLNAGVALSSLQGEFNWQAFAQTRITLVDIQKRSLLKALEALAPSFRLIDGLFDTLQTYFFLIVEGDFYNINNLLIGFTSEVESGNFANISNFFTHITSAHYGSMSLLSKMHTVVEDEAGKEDGPIGELIHCKAAAEPCSSITKKMENLCDTIEVLITKNVPQEDVDCIKKLLIDHFIPISARNFARADGKAFRLTRFNSGKYVELIPKIQLFFRQQLTKKGVTPEIINKRIQALGEEMSKAIENGISDAQEEVQKRLEQIWQEKYSTPLEMSQHHWELLQDLYNSEKSPITGKDRPVALWASFDGAQPFAKRKSITDPPQRGNSPD